LPVFASFLPEFSAGDNTDVVEDHFGRSCGVRSDDFERSID
jgi:hypothetical protein